MDKYTGAGDNWPKGSGRHECYLDAQRAKKKVISSGILVLLARGFGVKYENEWAEEIKKYSQVL